MKVITPVVIGIIRKRNKYLLTKRRQEREWPNNKWQFPGGELMFGERFEEALVRELIEEVGVKVERIFYPPLVYESLRKSWHGVLICYVCPIKANPKLNIRLNDESSDYGWFTLEEINNLDVLPKVKEMARDSKSVGDRT